MDWRHVNSIDEMVRERARQMWFSSGLWRSGGSIVDFIEAAKLDMGIPDDWVEVAAYFIWEKERDCGRIPGTAQDDWVRAQWRLMGDKKHQTTERAGVGSMAFA